MIVTIMGVADDGVLYLRPSLSNNHSPPPFLFITHPLKLIHTASICFPPHAVPLGFRLVITRNDSDESNTNFLDSLVFLNRSMNRQSTPINNEPIITIGNNCKSNLLQ